MIIETNLYDSMSPDEPGGVVSPMKKRIAFGGIFAGILAISSTASPALEKATRSEVSAAPEAHANSGIWFHGSVAEALAAAKKRDRPLFLYWGATWCPPCNALKAEVFSNPRFGELMKSFVAVYLDGDTDQAQSWGERFHVSGYPTILVLNSQGAELTRIVESVSFAEFDEGVRAALVSKRPIAETLELAKSGHASEGDWQLLALLPLNDVPDLKLTAEQKLLAQRELADAAPQSPPQVRSILAARLLEMAAAAQSDVAKAIAADIRKNSKIYIDRFFASQSTRRAARATIAAQSQEVIDWLQPDKKSHDYHQLRNRWLRAAAEISADRSLATDLRLMAAHPEYVFSRYERGTTKPILPAIRSRIIREVRAADARAKTSYERHSALPTAVELLMMVGETKQARALLDRELATSDTPWFYEGIYSRLEKNAGNENAAMEWSRKARLSVKGRSTKLQWIVFDMMTTANAKTKDESRLAEIATNYYETAFGLDDGFSGRNAKQAKSVAKLLKPVAKTESVAKVVAAFSAACEEGKSKDGKKCTDHFATLSE